MRFVIFQINADFLTNQLRKNFKAKHLRLFLHSNKKCLLSIPQVFRSNHFLPHGNWFSKRISCTIFQINTDLLVVTKTLIILHKRLYIPPLFREKPGVLYRKRFLKHPLFTTFSLFLKVSEVCNTSNKH